MDLLYCTVAYCKQMPLLGRLPCLHRQGHSFFWSGRSSHRQAGFYNTRCILHGHLRAGFPLTPANCYALGPGTWSADLPTTCTNQHRNTLAGNKFIAKPTMLSFVQCKIARNLEASAYCTVLFCSVVNCTALLYGVNNGRARDPYCIVCYS